VIIDARAERASTERINAWREGRLRFDSWPLEDAVREHNRYARSLVTRLRRNEPFELVVEHALLLQYVLY
jgi:ferric-dicitrate binding protein FerR (iron transport regulator)